MYPTWRLPQQQWLKHVVDVDKLYTSDKVVVLRLLYPYRIITLSCFNIFRTPIRTGNIESEFKTLLFGACLKLRTLIFYLSMFWLWLFLNSVFREFRNILSCPRIWKIPYTHSGCIQPLLSKEATAVQLIKKFPESPSKYQRDII